MKTLGKMLLPLLVWGTLASQISNSEVRAEKGKAVVTAVGDVTLAHRFNAVIGDVRDVPYEYPFSEVRKYFQDSVTIANLESALTNHDKKVSKKFNFRGKPEYARCLSSGSIEIVNLANNHTYDYGRKGLEDTLKALEKEKIIYCGGGLNIGGAREAKVVVEKGVRIAFLGYADVGKSFGATKVSAGVAPCFDSYVKEDVKKAREKADIVVVSFHYGIEQGTKPTTRQRQVSKLAVDSGADIVLGHHPHVVQGIENYKRGLIFYSLGNFCFGGNINPSDKDSFIARIEVTKGGVGNYSIIPVRITGRKSLQPYAAEGLEKDRIVKKVMGRSYSSSAKTSS